jgi:hypothetical protein
MGKTRVFAFKFEDLPGFSLILDSSNGEYPGIPDSWVPAAGKSRDYFFILKNQRLLKFFSFFKRAGTKAGTGLAFKKSEGGFSAD